MVDARALALASFAVAMLVTVALIPTWDHGLGLGSALTPVVGVMYVGLCAASVGAAGAAIRRRPDSATGVVAGVALAMAFLSGLMSAYLFWLFRPK